MAQKLQLRSALEASRGALLATHAASGLSASATATEAVRLCRAAEGLIRAAVASLYAKSLESGADDKPSEPSPPRRRRRPRAKRSGGQVADTGDKPSERPGGAGGGAGAGAGGSAEGSRGNMVVAMAAVDESSAAAVVAPGAMDVDGYMEGGELSSLVAASAPTSSRARRGAASSCSAGGSSVPRSSGGTVRAPWCSCGQKNKKSAWFCVSCGSQLVWGDAGKQQYDADT